MKDRISNCRVKCSGIRLSLAFFALMFWLSQHLAPPASASEKLDLFFLSVGSEHYAMQELGQLRGINRSATQIASLLLEGGAKGGLVLTSRPDAYVSREDVFTALERLISDALSANAASPAIVVYLAGHGLSEGIGWNQFLIPGNVSIRGLAPDFSDGQSTANLLEVADIEIVAEELIYVAEVVDLLKATGIPYVLLIDACQEGVEQDAGSPVLTQEATGNIEDVFAVLRVWNQFRGPDPVIFSTAPGTVVSTAPDPVVPQLSVAPLARRLMLIAQNSRKAGRELSPADLAVLLSNPDLDVNETPPAVTHMEMAEQNLSAVLLRYRGGAVGNFVETHGTANSLVECCIAELSSNESGAQVADFSSAMLSVSGPAGDFLTEGGTYRITATGEEIWTINNTAGSFDVVLNTEDSHYMFTLRTRSADAFAERSYTASEIEFSVSIDARGCEFSSGSVAIDHVRHNQRGQIAAIVLEFEHFCDESAEPAIGWLELSAQ